MRSYFWLALLSPAWRWRLYRCWAHSGCTSFPARNRCWARFLRRYAARLPGAEEGFHPNQVAGTLLYVFPLLLTISASYLTRNYRIDMAWPWLPWIIVPAALFTGVVIVLAQSRSALLGLTLGVVFIALVQYRWGRIALIVGAVALMAAAPFVAPRALDVIADAPPVEAMGGTASVENFRRILWAQALAAATDFPLTGMGLGTYRELVRVLYPLDICAEL